MVLATWGIRAVWTWWTTTAYPQQVSLKERTIIAQERVADAVEGMKLVQQTLSTMTERMFERITNIEMDMARLYQIKQQDQPSNARRSLNK